MSKKTLTTQDLIDIAKHFSTIKRIPEKRLTPEQRTARKALNDELNKQFDPTPPEGV
jgi:hypothetical protein